MSHWNHYVEAPPDLELMMNYVRVFKVTENRLNYCLKTEFLLAWDVYGKGFW